MSMRPLLAALLFGPSFALADHPLLTEDTGVLGKGTREVEVHGERPRDGGATQIVAVLGYGITERADLELELPYVRHVGTGDPALALKWRFYDAGPASMAFKPFVSDEYRGADIAAAYELGRLECIGHLGYLRNQSTSLWHASIALLWSATEKLRLLVDFGRDSNGETVSTRVLGLTYELAEDLDLGFGVKAGAERAWLFGAKLRW